MVLVLLVKVAAAVVAAAAAHLPAAVVDAVLAALAALVDLVVPEHLAVAAALPTAVESQYVAQLLYRAAAVVHAVAALSVKQRVHVGVGAPAVKLAVLALPSVAQYRGLQSAKTPYRYDKVLQRWTLGVVWLMSAQHNLPAHLSSAASCLVGDACSPDSTRES